MQCVLIGPHLSFVLAGLSMLSLIGDNVGAHRRPGSDAESYRLTTVELL